MKLTNNANLPQPIADAVANDDYDRGSADISVTQLIAPPRQIALIEKHNDELTEDVAERIYALVGQAVHTILERAERTAATEERLSMDVLGWTVSGKFDRMVYEHGHLQDYKLVSVYEIQHGLKTEKTEQLNLLAHLLRNNGYEVNKLEAVCILRDWSKRQARRDPSYPQQQVQVIELDLWFHDYTQAFLEHRVGLHQMARNYLPECDAEERWARPDTYAVMKKGNKRASRVLDSEDEAVDWIAQQDKGSFEIEYRPGESVRCESYCLAADFCSQWAAIRPEPVDNRVT